MSNRTHLVPDLTVDKNGRQTTVYRSPGTSLSAMAVPAPVVGPSRHDELVRETAADLLQDYYTAGEAPTRQRVVAEMRKYPIDLLEELREVITRVDSSVPLDSLRDSLCELIAEQPSEAKVREALLLYPALCQWNPDIAEGIIESLHEYDQIPSWSDLSAESDEVKAKCVAVATVVSNVHALGGLLRTQGKNHVVRLEDALVGLIVEYPDRAGQIAETIIERRSADPVLLRGIIASDSRVLGEGSL